MMEQGDWLGYLFVQCQTHVAPKEKFILDLAQVSVFFPIHNSQTSVC